MSCCVTGPYDRRFLVFPLVSLAQYQGLNCMPYGGSGCAMLVLHAAWLWVGDR